jgi:hypothetical protein
LLSLLLPLAIFAAATTAIAAGEIERDSTAAATAVLCRRARDILLFSLLLPLPLVIFAAATTAITAGKRESLPLQLTANQHHQQHVKSQVLSS